jgi:hypothetical protein
LLVYKIVWKSLCRKNCKNNESRENISELNQITTIALPVLSRLILISSLLLKFTSSLFATTRIKIPAKYITDLDFADDIMLVSDDAINSYKQLDAVDIMPRRVGLKINKAKTEFMMIANWASPIELRVSTSKINLVKDFKYLGSWLLNCIKDFEIRKALAWKACILLVKIWKSNSISSAVKIIKLFRACVESTLLCNAVTWTLTDAYSRKQVRRLLHKAVTLCIES